MKLLSYEIALSLKAKLCFNAVVKREDHAKAETNKSLKIIHLQLRKMTEKKILPVFCNNHKTLSS